MYYSYKTSIFFYCVAHTASGALVCPVRVKDKGLVHIPFFGRKNSTRGPLIGRKVALFVGTPELEQELFCPELESQSTEN